MNTLESKKYIMNVEEGNCSTHVMLGDTNTLICSSLPSISATASGDIVTEEFSELDDNDREEKGSLEEDGENSQPNICSEETIECRWSGENKNNTVTEKNNGKRKKMKILSTKRKSFVRRRKETDDRNINLTTQYSILACGSMNFINLNIPQTARLIDVTEGHNTVTIKYKSRFQLPKEQTASLFLLAKSKLPEHKSTKRNAKGHTVSSIQNRDTLHYPKQLLSTDQPRGQRAMFEENQAHSEIVIQLLVDLSTELCKEDMQATVGLVVGIIFSPFCFGASLLATAHCNFRRPIFSSIAKRNKAFKMTLDNLKLELDGKERVLTKIMQYTGKDDQLKPKGVFENLIDFIENQKNLLGAATAIRTLANQLKERRY